MKNVLVSILLLLAMTIAAQEQNVAVYVTGPQPGINKILGDQFVKSFAQSGDYKAIERTASFLTELNKEQSYQEGGAVDNNQITRLGKQFGAQLVCVVEVLDAFGQYYVSARLIAVETAEVLNSSNAYSKLDNLQEVITVASSMAEELTGIVALKEQGLAKLKKAVEAGYMQIGDVYYLVTPLTQEFTQSEAYEYASTFTYGGLKGWRLPTCQEALMINNEVKKYHAIYPNFPDLETRKRQEKIRPGIVAISVATIGSSNCTSSQGNSTKTSQSNQDTPNDTPPRINYQHYWCTEKSFYLHEGKIHDRGKYSKHIFLVRDTSTAIADALALKYELEQQRKDSLQRIEQQKKDSVEALKSSLKKALGIGYVQIGDIYLLNQIFDAKGYRGAVKYANKLTFGGLKGWRLPTSEEAMMVANKLDEFDDIVSGFIDLDKYSYRYWCSETFFYLDASKRKIVDCERGERFHFFLVRDVE